MLGEASEVNDGVICQGRKGQVLFSSSFCLRFLMARVGQLGGTFSRFVTVFCCCCHLSVPKLKGEPVSAIMVFCQNHTCKILLLTFKIKLKT